VWIALGCYFAKYTLLFTFFEGTHYCVSIACNGASVPVVKELRLPSLSLGEICPIYQFELCLSLAVVDENSFYFATNLPCFKTWFGFPLSMQILSVVKVQENRLLKQYSCSIYLLFNQ